MAEKLARLEKIVFNTMLVEAKASLPEGFNEKALEGLDPLDQVEFINRFKAALPKATEKTPATRQIGAQVPAKAAKPQEGASPGSMAERAKFNQELLKGNQGKPGVVSGMYK
jgi:hypothetical protein